METGQTARELMDRSEIRENVTQALASLRVSSLLDVDQISSALLQSTVSIRLVFLLVCFISHLSAIYSEKLFINLNFSLPEAVPSELVCGNCQKRVLEAVGKMIHVMEEQLGPGVLSAAETGMNILNIIGAVPPPCPARNSPALSVNRTERVNVLCSVCFQATPWLLCLSRPVLPALTQPSRALCSQLPQSPCQHWVTQGP